MSGTALLLGVVLVAAAPATARAPQVADDATAHAFVEVVPERAISFEHQPLTLKLRFGFERDFLERSLVQLFRRPLDVPAQLEVGWFDHPPGLVARPTLTPESTTTKAAAVAPLRCALNDGEAEVVRKADERRGGRDFAVFELARSYLAGKAGAVALAAPRLRFAFATRFDDDLLRGRTALDRSDAQIMGSPLALTIELLPDAGRPADFIDAVGTFRGSAAASASSGAGADDNSFRLTLTIEGDGNLEEFTTPRFEELRAFDRLGTLEQKSATRRTIAIDLKARPDSPATLPALSFSGFSPGPPSGYRIIRFDPVALPTNRSTRTAPTSTPTPTPTPTPTSEPAPSVAPPSSSTSRRTGVTLAIVVACVCALLFARRRRETAAGGDDGSLQARRTAADFDARLVAPDADLSAAFADYLAARLRSSQAAVIAPELAARLCAAGVDPDLAERAARFMRKLVARRYGGAASRIDADAAGTVDAARDLVRELEAAFDARSRDEVGQ